MTRLDMAAYGLTGRELALAASYAPLVISRIVSQERGLYRAVSASGETLCEISGKLRFMAQTAADYPTVGDFVMLDAETSGQSATIHAVLPRRSVFTRKAAGAPNEAQLLAANVDTVFLCMSLNRNYSLRRLERLLAIGWNSGATPVVLLTKSDLCPSAPERTNQARLAAVGAEVLCVTAMASDGYDQILPYLTYGKTVALIGASGVGKSTLVNRLLGKDLLETGDLRENDRGRHTTTRRELILLDGGGMLIDTPGMRELGVWEAEDGVSRTFADVESFAEQCRYADCTHSGEAGCAVAAAIESGALQAERLQAWQKLRSELTYTENKSAYLSKKRDKSRLISKINKANRRRSE